MRIRQFTEKKLHNRALEAATCREQQALEFRRKIGHRVQAACATSKRRVSNSNGTSAPASMPLASSNSGMSVLSFAISCSCVPASVARHVIAGGNPDFGFIVPLGVDEIGLHALTPSNDQMSICQSLQRQHKLHLKALLMETVGTGGFQTRVIEAPIHRLPLSLDTSHPEPGQCRRAR